MDSNPYNYQQAHDKKLKADVCVAAIVKVISFDKIKMTVDVQPLSKHLNNGKYESQPQILKVPVAVTHCADFIFRPWFKEGDVGIVVYLDHDMNNVVASGKEAVPLTERNHATSDAVFIGGIVAGEYQAIGFPDESVVLAKDDAKIYVAVTKEKIEFKNESTTGEVTKDEIKVKTTTVTIAADTVNINGKVIATGDVLSESSISGAHHTHPGDSGGRTGPPG